MDVGRHPNIEILTLSELAQLKQRNGSFVATVRKQPRHVDLRPFVFFDGREVTVPRGGLTRVALEEGQMVVNSSQDGGAKATWIG